jgi:meiotic recombination protein SPO11
MLKCRQLKAALREKVDEDGPNGKVVPESIKSEEIVEVAELSATEVLEGIEGVALRIAKQVLGKQGFTLDVPSRSATNQIYVKEWDRIVLGGKRSTRTFTNVRVRTECLFECSPFI